MSRELRTQIPNITQSNLFNKNFMEQKNGNLAQGQQKIIHDKRYRIKERLAFEKGQLV